MTSDGICNHAWIVLWLVLYPNAIWRFDDTMKCICNVCTYVRMYACMYMCVYVCMYVCICVCMDACMHACMNVCVYVWRLHVVVRLDVCNVVTHDYLRMSITKLTQRNPSQPLHMWCPSICICCIPVINIGTVRWTRCCRAVADTGVYSWNNNYCNG
jgi:hypothetical protein